MTCGLCRGDHPDDYCQEAHALERKMNFEPFPTMMKTFNCGCQVYTSMDFCPNHPLGEKPRLQLDKEPPKVCSSCYMLDPFHKSDCKTLKPIKKAPTRASTIPTDAKGRKEHPIASGVLDYFPDAIVALSRVSWLGNEQHHPDKPLHWDRAKSTDEGDALMRHFLARGTLDSDGIRHSAKMAWRALALLQKEIENE